ncbi:MAG TPA: zf-HC2 domain-containing protein [Mycobacterium sp.]|jgi:anti-sigma factor RsiW|nr:zf-HC2 domain-containing protein [Mycobacterium sp.]
MTACDKQTWVGAYLLDALEPDEAETLRGHLAECPVCQDEVVNLSPIQALLRSVQAADIEWFDDAAASPPDLLDRLLAASKAARCRRRPLALLLAAAAAVTIAGGVAVGSGALDSRHRPAALRAVTTPDRPGATHAMVTMQPRSPGSELHLIVSGAPPRAQCVLIAHARDGRSEIAATWIASYEGTATVSGTTAIPIDQLTQIDITTTAGRQLAQLPVAHEPAPATNPTGGR